MFSSFSIFFFLPVNTFWPAHGLNTQFSGVFWFSVLFLSGLLVKIPVGSGRGWRVVGWALGRTQCLSASSRSEKKLSSLADLWAVGIPPEMIKSFMNLPHPHCKNKCGSCVVLCLQRFSLSDMNDLGNSHMFTWHWGPSLFMHSNYLLYCTSSER